MTLVLDSSMALSWFFEDECTEAAKSVLERVVDEGSVAVAVRSGQRARHGASAWSDR